MKKPIDDEPWDDCDWKFVDDELGARCESDTLSSIGLDILRLFGFFIVLGLIVVVLMVLFNVKDK